MNPQELHLVPESLLKKRHDLDALKARRAAALIADPRVSRKRVSDKSKTVRIVKPETLLVQSRARKNAAARYNRVNKKGMQKRASEAAVVKSKYWDGEREEEVDEAEVSKRKELDERTERDDGAEEEAATSKEAGQTIQRIPYKANSVGASSIFAVLIRPASRSAPKTVRRALSALRLRRAREGVFLRCTASVRKVLHLVSPYVLYGVPSVETVGDLVRRRGFCRSEGKRVQISDNNIVEKELGDAGLICLEDLIAVLAGEGVDGDSALFGRVSKFLWPFRMSARKSKFQKRMLDLKDGKLYGDQGELMNGYIREML